MYVFRDDHLLLGNQWCDFSRRRRFLLPSAFLSCLLVPQLVLPSEFLNSLIAFFASTLACISLLVLSLFSSCLGSHCVSMFCVSSPLAIMWGRTVNILPRFFLVCPQFLLPVGPTSSLLQVRNLFQAVTCWQVSNCANDSLFRNFLVCAKSLRMDYCGGLDITYVQTACCFHLKLDLSLLKP